jgi:hypothetical protein
VFPVWFPKHALTVLYVEITVVTESCRVLAGLLDREGDVGNIQVMI